jgi:hypothetical protein
MIFFDALGVQVLTGLGEAGVVGGVPQVVRF